MDTFYQSLVTTNTQVENTNAIFASERQNTSDVLEEKLKGLTLDSTINNSAYYNSDEYDAESDPNSDPLATHNNDRKKIKFTDTDTINGNSPQKLLINRTLPIIIPPIYPPIAGGFVAIRGTMHARQTIFWS